MNGTRNLVPFWPNSERGQDGFPKLGDMGLGNSAVPPFAKTTTGSFFADPDPLCVVK